ncbi:MAG: DUF2807 domain-containing protein [Cyclobacteriaceae bacterium]|nr:DUF2807 domain-containing protein [Cyclobacteriaceae bacterium]
MKRIAVLVLITVFGTSVFAQKTATRKLEKFTAISASEGIDVTLVKGSSYEAKITASGIEMEDVLTEVSGGRLKIHLDGGNHRNIDVNVEVTFVSLNEIKASSAADIKSSSVIEADMLEIDASSAADIDLKIKVKELHVDASSSADITLSGTADKQNVDISSAADYKAFELVSKEGDISASSAADANVNVTESLYASASSGASVRYKGNPDKVKEHSSSGGDVEQY